MSLKCLQRGPFLVHHNSAGSGRPWWPVVTHGDPWWHPWPIHHWALGIHTVKFTIVSLWSPGEKTWSTWTEAQKLQASRFPIGFLIHGDTPNNPPLFAGIFHENHNHPAGQVNRPARTRDSAYLWWASSCCQDRPASLRKYRRKPY